MQRPPISTIQAGIILRPVLVCSRDETAFGFASIHFARTISVGIYFFQSYLCRVLTASRWPNELAFLILYIRSTTVWKPIAHLIGLYG